MPYVLKPKFEQARNMAFKHLKPMREGEVQKIQAGLVDFLQDVGDILVERARRPNHTDPLLEVNGFWFGPAASHDEVTRVLKHSWPWPCLEGLEANANVEHLDEVVQVRVLATAGDRYLTAVVHIRV